jgi:4-amino-4-deoxy-L-arabinose transferase-like glycosyltransferase
LPQGTAIAIVTSPSNQLPFVATNRWLFQVITVVLILLFALGNLPWTLDDYDQAKQAFVSYQMLGQHRWLFQTTPTEGLPARGERHSQFHLNSKPPAIGWASVVFYEITRSWDLAWRFPSFLAAIALAFLIFTTAKKAFGDLAALAAFSAFGFNSFSPRLATLVRTDMPLALVCFAIGVVMFDKARTGRAWTTRQRVMLFAFLVAGLFIKGPIVYAFVLPPVVIYQILQRWRGDFPTIWSGWWPWSSSFAIFLAWVTTGALFVPGFYYDVIQVEFAERFREGIHHSQPLLFYVPHLLHKFAPWSLLMIALFILAIRQTHIGSRTWLREISPEMCWLLAWAVGGIIVMSLIPSKRPDRIFPSLPPLCLLLAAQLNYFRQRKHSEVLIRRVVIAGILASAVYAGGYTATRVIHGYRTHRDALEEFGREVRRSARTSHLRYEVVRAPDEGLLLYLQRPRFLTFDRAAALWREGALDGLVLRANDELKLAQLPEIELPPRLTAIKDYDSDAKYIFVTRKSSSAPVAP